MSKIASSQQFTYRPEIDGLRALAVVSVIIYHLNKDLLPSGYLGVDIFFVISGFVITSSLHSSLNKGFWDFLLDFYSRRVKRLAPALLLCVAIGSILICFFNPEPTDSMMTGIRALYGFSNVYLYGTSTNYFATATELNVFTHTWSLGVEEQFYLVYPLLLWALSSGRQYNGNAKRSIFIISVISVFSLISFGYLSFVNHAAAFFLVTSRFWELGIGCLVLLLQKEELVNRYVTAFPALLALSLLGLALFVPQRFEVTATVAVVILTALVIASIKPETNAYYVLTQSSIVTIGILSYSLYLWHWIVIAISRWTIGIHWWSVPIQIVVMLILAIVSHRFVEKPLRHVKWSSFRRMSIIYGLGASVIASMLLVVLLKTVGQQLYLGDRRSVIKKKSVSSVLANHSTATKRFKLVRAECNMTPQYLTGESYRPKPIVDAMFIRNNIGVSSFPKKILLVGDSFANRTSEHLSVIANKLGRDFRMIFGYGCPYPFPSEEIKSGAGAQCKELDVILLRQEIIDSLHEGDLLVIRLFFQKPQYLVYAKGKLPAVDAYDNAIENVLNAVRAKKAKLLIIGSNPTLTTSQFQAMSPQWFNVFSVTNTGYVINTDSPENTYFNMLDNHLQQFLRDVDSVSYFSIKKYLCNDNEMCKITDNGNYLYFDEQHLTVYAHDLFFDNLDKHIIKFLLPGDQKRNPIASSLALPDV